MKNKEKSDRHHQSNIEHVCFYLPSFGDGGVERMITNIAYGLSEKGVKVDFIINGDDHPFIHILEGRVNFIEPDTTPNNAIIWFADYLATQKPQISMTIKDLDDYIAIKAKKMSGVPTKIIIRTGTAIKTRFKQRGANPLKTWYKSYKLKKMYRRADGHIAVAQGTKKELKEVIKVPESDIVVIKNPVITPALLEQQHHHIDHPWFEPDEKSLIMGMGGFRKQKDFSTLIQAFSIVHQRRPCRLIILGQGRQEKRLKKLCEELAIADDVCFPGFTDNPYPWLKRADLFVLSSLWEGSPNVLTEALAVGTPVVSTDCQSGPRETLQDGRYGELVPLKNPEAMAQAIEHTLDNPLPENELKAAVQDYTVAASSEAYLRAFEFFMSR